MVQGRVGLCGDLETWQRGCRRAGTEQVEKPVSSPATGDGATRCQSDELKPLDEEGKRLYQRIVAKLNYLAHDRRDLKYPTSCLASAATSHCLWDMQVAKRVRRYLRKALVASQVSPFTTHGSESSCAARMSTGPQTRLLEGRRAEVSRLLVVESSTAGRRSKIVLHCHAGKASCSQRSRRARDFGDPERVDGSWVQLQCHCCDRQSERH